mgnify:CR=1 FL=1
MSSIKLTADSGGGTFEIKAPSSSGNTRVLTLPDTGNITLSDTNGVTMVDSWVVTASFDVSGSSDITANWAKHSAGGSQFGTIGTGMTESSGIFTFPITGIYAVTTTMSARCDSGARSYIGMRHYYSTNSGGAYANTASGYSSGTSSTDHVFGSTTVIYDVTDVSTHRIKFNVEASSASKYFGNATNKNTGVTFIRLGDT